MVPQPNVVPMVTDYKIGDQIFGPFVVAKRRTTRYGPRPAEVLGAVVGIQANLERKNRKLLFRTLPILACTNVPDGHTQAQTVDLVGR